VAVHKGRPHSAQNREKLTPSQGRRQKNFHGGSTEKIPKNSTFQPLSTIFVLCMKIQGGHGPPALRCRHPCPLPFLSEKCPHCSTSTCLCGHTINFKKLIFCTKN